MKKNLTFLLLFRIGYVIGTLLFFCLVVLLMQCLWNVTIPEIFGIKELTFTQAMRLYVLVHLLFGTTSLWTSSDKQ